MEEFLDGKIEELRAAIAECAARGVNPHRVSNFHPKVSVSPTISAFKLNDSGDGWYSSCGVEDIVADEPVGVNGGWFGDLQVDARLARCVFLNPGRRGLVDGVFEKSFNLLMRSAFAYQARFAKVCESELRPEETRTAIYDAMVRTLGSLEGLAAVLRRKIGPPSTVERLELYLGMTREGREAETREEKLACSQWGSFFDNTWSFGSAFNKFKFAAVRDSITAGDPEGDSASPEDSAGPSAGPST